MLSIFFIQEVKAMLELKQITKDYPAGDGQVHALRGIDLQFRKSEFVSILGPSGCGKTTMLNIIGGLDQYTAGDLVINGRSTKDFKDRDWDAYRNHSVGFVFQSYNLIPHQSVLQNVELALTLSGVPKQERRQRAKKALEQVGLGDQLKKKPGEMSGGQMQRVAIARALVNDPDIILADEPTGALDTETSLQVMEILKEVAKDRLVVMVTHNPDLAEKYSTRIIRMLDGVITDDSMPVTEREVEAVPQKVQGKVKKPSMSFGTAFMLSLKNLFTKKGRTTLTAFAGSIGIIGIALILAVSQGTTAYIDYVQESTLSSYPLTLESTTVDMSALMQGFMNGGGESTHDTDAIYKDPIIGELVDAMSKIEANENDLAAFKAYLDAQLADQDSALSQALSGVQYTYALSPVIYTKDPDGQIIKSDIGELMMEMIGDFMVAASGNQQQEDASGMCGASVGGSPMMNAMFGMNMWQELLPDLQSDDPVNHLIKEQYDLIYGAWPNEYDEVVLVVNSKNELDDLTLYAMGLMDRAQIDAIIDAAAKGEELDDSVQSWAYEDVCGLTFRTILPYDCYRRSGDIFVDVSSNENMLKVLYEEALELRVVGIIRPNENADTAMLSGSICYTHGLTEYIIEQAAQSEIVQAQLADPMVDVLTGLPFKSNTGALSDEEKQTEFLTYVADLNDAERAKIYVQIQAINTVAAQMDAQVEGILASMQDREALVDQISTAISQQMGMDAAQIQEYLAETTLEELKEMLRPSLEEQVAAAITAQVTAAYAQVPAEQLLMLLEAELPGYTLEQNALYYNELTEFSDSTYEQNLVRIGALDLDDPQSINLYASSFENKDLIVEAISEYNSGVEEAKKIAYTDYLGIMMSSITTIINAITYVLIAFVAISLVVSSIMIGVITLISVQERTKEIGILRAIGASKKNVSSMFTAETVIIGFAAGLLGVVVTYLLCIPINAIINHLTGIPNLDAILPVNAAIILVGISVVLTLIAGMIPSRSAAKKDPVVALRTE